MSTVLSSEPTVILGMNAGAVLRRYQTATFIAVAAFALGVFGYYFDRFWWAPDDGAYVHIAERILNGEVLNGGVQDIRFGYGNFANAAALWLFGDNLVSLRYPLVIMGVVQSCLVFLLLLPRGMLVAAAASVAMTALSTVHFLNPSAHWYSLFLFITIVGALTWLPRGGRYRLEMVGFLLVTLLLFRQLSGVIAAMGVLAYLLSEAPHGPRGRSRFLARALILLMMAGLGGYLLTKTDILGFALFGIWPLCILAWVLATAAVDNRHTLWLLFRLGLGGAAAAAPLVLYHWLNGSFATWFDDTFLAALALTKLDTFTNVSYGVLLVQGLGQVFTMNSFAAVVNGLFWVALVLLAPVLGILVLRGFLRRGTLDPALQPLPFLGVFYAMVSVHFQIPIYLFFSVAVTLAGVLWLTTDGRTWRRHLPVAFACGLSVVGLYYQAGQPTSRGLAGILAGERVTLVHDNLLDRGGLWVEARDLRLYRELVAVIRRESQPEESILALPVNPELYYLGRRKNPFRFFNSALGIHNEVELQDVLTTLSTAPPRLVFHRPDDKYNTAYSDRVMAYVQAHYEHLASRSGFEIYRLPKRG